MRYERIAVDHDVMGGVPCIRGTRFPVATIVSMVAEGMGAERIVGDFPQLTRDDVRAALEFAADAVRERELPLRPTA